MRIGTGVSVERDVSYVADRPHDAKTSAAASTANEVVREVVMPRTVGGASNRPATGEQQGANRALSGP
jgi:hypothetical protein